MNMFKFLVNLGLWRGGEHTYKKLNSLLTVCTTSEEKRNSYTVKQKWVCKNRIIDEFLKYTDTLQKPSEDLCDKLPLPPHRIIAQTPDVVRQRARWQPAMSYENRLGRSRRVRSHVQLQE
jgi:hypothetical protein